MGKDLNNLHHVGLVMSDDKMEDIIDKFWKCGIDLGDPECKRIDKFQCDCILFNQIEMVIPDEGSKLHSWLSESITPIHHIAMQVDDIYQKMEEMKEMGVPVLYDKPVDGVSSTLVNFVHPMYMGFLLEIVQVVKNED